MKCPKCHTDNPKNASVCKSCGSPLSDAVYTPIDSGSVKKGRRMKWPLIILLLVLLLTCGGFFGYKYYLSRVEKECLTFTKELFKGLKALDLSNIEEKYHPEKMPIDPDLKGVVKEKIGEVFESSPLSSFVDIDSLNIDYDFLFEEMTRDADYKIVSCETSWNKCTVKVTTSNADFSQLPKLILQEAQEDITSLADPENIAGILSDLYKNYVNSHGKESVSPRSEDDTETNTRGNIGKNTEDDAGDNTEDDTGDGTEESEETGIISNFTRLLVKWYKEVKKETPKKTKTADFVFKLKDGKWTMDSFDQDLIYSFYGVPSDILE